MGDAAVDPWEGLEFMAFSSDARDLWATETSHLTPWLVENLDAVAKCVGLRLKGHTVRREVSLGGFRADVVVEDELGRTVVIEVQFGPTDHDHFAKVVLYALEARASVVVWVVAGAGGRWRLWSGVRHEHKRALDRLNLVFAGEIDFYAISIDLRSEPIRGPSADYPLIPRWELAVAPTSVAHPAALPPAREPR